MAKNQAADRQSKIQPPGAAQFRAQVAELQKQLDTITAERDWLRRERTETIAALTAMNAEYVPPAPKPVVATEPGATPSPATTPVVQANEPSEPSEPTVVQVPVAVAPVLQSTMPPEVSPELANANWRFVG